MANGHGGARPNAGGRRDGSGRKPKASQGYNEQMRSILEEIVTPEAWQKVCRSALSYAMAGDKDARRWLAPWVLGAEPKEVKLTGDNDAPLRVVVEYADSNAETAEPA